MTTAFGRILRILGRGLGVGLVTVAKTIGGMTGKNTFGHDNATALYMRRDDYRP